MAVLEDNSRASDFSYNHTQEVLRLQNQHLYDKITATGALQKIGPRPGENHV